MKKLFGMATLGLAVLIGSSFASAQDWRYDRDDSHYDRGYGYDHYRHGLRAAHETGYRDGLEVAREDTWRGKPYNPNPRGKYAWADRGYRREFGDRFRRLAVIRHGDSWLTSSRPSPAPGSGTAGMIEPSPLLAEKSAGRALITDCTNPCVRW